MGLKAALPKAELCLYVLVLSLAILWAASWICEASAENMSRRSFKSSVKQGWAYIGRKMDVADFEWVMWFTKFRNYILFALSGHVLFGKAISMTVPQHRSLYFMAYGILAVLATMGVSYLMLILVHCILLYSIGLAKQKWLCFAAGLCSLATFKLEPMSSWQVNQSKLIRKENEMWNIRKYAIAHLTVIILVDIFFHYLYILTIPSDLKLVARLSDWALACLAYFNLVYDWIKAAVMFGVVGTVARLDYLDPPKPPKCITMLYVFAETHFDRGINDWLCKYVYDYLGEDHDNILKELLATICTFLITTLWLGPETVVYIWSVCNCFGLNFELWVQKFFQLEPFASIEANQISEAMSRRIRGVFGAANFWAIILYNILSLNSVDFALLVARRLFLTGFPWSLLSVLFVTYCGIQLIKENERRLAMEADKEKVD
ncbi:hedgehog acyltransferase like, b isoform X2 [Chiloscyllium plagiosum]|uniref:hedgehog acyltransferase like, b isoform X2 n=1 Tax=Chiloscyllium plagiosum TaxID=36176 RepID=UPI001CB81310|nr:hedgehog acyltransferase like, b isoform X2 [Chiloscyllium plagiosum]